MDAAIPGTTGQRRWAVSCVGLRSEQDEEAISAGRLPDEIADIPHVRLDAVNASSARADLHAVAHRCAEPFERRGEPVVLVGRDGRAFHMNAAADAANGRLFGVVGGRIATLLSADQRKLDGIVDTACSDGRPGLVSLTVFSEPGQAFALASPVPVGSRDVVQAVSALIVFLEAGQRLLPVNEGALALLRDAAGLTSREVDVVRLIAAGSAPGWAARSLGISPGTTRLHLKSIFSKLGVHSQAELSTLVGRLA